MNLILFCTAFILQFVGHRIGDYLFQTDWQASNKAKNPIARVRHVLIYSSICSCMLLFQFDMWTVAMVFLMTFCEHSIIDSRTPIVWWKNFFESRLARRKDFEIDKLPFFVLIEIDQSVHYTRIFVISLLIGYGLL